MTGYEGHFLKGLAGGIQSGINMGTQLQEMRWQKKQRKELEEKQAKMLEVSNLWNAKIKEAGTDNIYSDEEIAQISTIYLSGGYEFMEHYQGAMEAIKSMNKAKYDQEKEWMDLFTSGVEGLPPGDIQAMYEYVQPYITSEKGKNTLEAYNNIIQKRATIAQNQPEDIWGQAATLPQDVRPEYLRSKGIEIPQPAEAPATELDKMGETQKKLDAAYATGNANYFNQMAKSLNIPTTFDTYKQGYEKPGAIGEGGVATEKHRVTSLPTLEKYRENTLNADSWEDAEKIINDYTEAGYDPSQLGIDKEAWANSQTEYLSNLLKAIKATANEKGWLKSGEITPQEVSNQIDKNAPAPDVYEEFRKEYMKYRDLLEKAGVDVSQFPKLKPLSEIEKVGFWEGVKTFSGVGKGQYKSIYY